MFGLHPNAEIGFLTATANDLFSTIVSMSGGSSNSASGSGAVGGVMDDILTRLPKGFDEHDVADRAKVRPGKALAPTSMPPHRRVACQCRRSLALTCLACLYRALSLSLSLSLLPPSLQPFLEDPLHPQCPFVVVLLQECGRANVLLKQIKKTLEELGKGLNGQLSMTEPMEHLSAALSINQVPGRNPFHSCSWERFAWPSKKSLASWTTELVERCRRFKDWASECELPKSLWMSGLFNPQAFLTAVKQATARKNQMPLDSMTVETHVTTMEQAEEAVEYPEDGAYVHGFFIEGARWSTPEECAEQQPEPTMVGNVPTRGWLMDARLKELMPALPLVFIKAVEVQPHWEAQAVGFMRHEPTIYDTPVYTTTMRGPTFVFMGSLMSVQDTSKWVLSGTAIIMQEND